MIPFEKLAAERIVRRAGITMTPLIEAQLCSLIRNIKDGDFCCSIESDLPECLWEEGREGGSMPQKALVIQDNRLYLQKTWALETLILQKVIELRNRPVKKIQPNFVAPLNDTQQKAIEYACANNLAIFTGGPGTGKTYTAGCFIRLFGEGKVIITAPTGKAATHLQSTLQDTVKCETATLHRLLRLQPHRQQFNSERLLDADLVVVDEASMLDASLLLHLLQAIGPNTRLLLLGDPNQLPPVEGTGFFPELSELFGQQLTTSMRTGEGSLRQLSQAILAGDADSALKIQDNEVEWHSWIDDPAELVKRLYIPQAHFLEKPDPKELLQQQKRFRILSALRQGPFGVDALNQRIMEQIPEGNGWTAIPILINQNSESQQLYNGTVGVLIRPESMAYFPTSTGVRSIPEAALPSYELAFCLSVHKSQGSEFEEVLILLGQGTERFGREALYTAVTRAKKKVSLYTDEATLKKTLNLGRKKRSGFVERIKISI